MNTVFRKTVISFLLGLLLFGPCGAVCANLFSMDAMEAGSLSGDGSENSPLLKFFLAEIEDITEMQERDASNNYPDSSGIAGTLLQTRTPITSAIASALPIYCRGMQLAKLFLLFCSLRIAPA